MNIAIGKIATKCSYTIDHKTSWEHPFWAQLRSERPGPRKDVQKTSISGRTQYIRIRRTGFVPGRY